MKEVKAAKEEVIVIIDRAKEYPKRQLSVTIPRQRIAQEQVATVVCSPAPSAPVAKRRLEMAASVLHGTTSDRQSDEV